MVTHRGNLNYQDCRRILLDGYVADAPNILDDEASRSLDEFSMKFGLCGLMVPFSLASMLLFPTVCHHVLSVLVSTAATDTESPLPDFT